MPEYEKTKHYFRHIKLNEYLRDHGDIGRAKAYADRLSQKSKASQEEKIAYSEINKVINLLDELKQ